MFELADTLYEQRRRWIMTVVIAVSLAIVCAVGPVLQTYHAPVAARVRSSNNPVAQTLGDDDLTRLANTSQHIVNKTEAGVLSGIMTAAVGITRFDTAVGHGSIAAAHSVRSGVAFGARGVSSATMFTIRTAGSVVLFGVHTTGSAALFTLRLPGKAISPLAHASHADAIIHSQNESQVPVIDTKLSAAMLAKLQVQAQADQQKNDQQIAAQLAANQHLSGVEVAGDASHGGYPAAWDAPTGQDSRLDSWGMYNRECVSYTAWKVYQTYGYMPYWGGVGNANQWIADAKNAGIETSSVPKVGSVAISMSGYYGHSMWVEAVSGNMIYVSQYNYDLHGHYSEMWVNGSSFTYLYFK